MISKGLHGHLQIYDMGQQAWLRWLLLGEFCYYPKALIPLIHAFKYTHVMKKEAWLRWLLLGEYGYHPIAHNFQIHALCINDRMQQKKACSFWFPLREFGHHMTSPIIG